MKVDTELTKLYYSIGEVAEMFSVSNSLIRYWETEFPMLKPQKNRKGDRRYKVKDIHILEKIYTLVKERGFTLDGARKEMSTRKKAIQKEDLSEVAQKLHSIKKKLEDLKNKLP